MTAKKEMVNAVEAALFSSERPLTLRDLQVLFDKRAKKESIEEALVQLQDDYRDRGVELVEVAGGFRFQTRAIHAPALRALRESRPPRYSRALLETLAIIAYRQPVTRGDIEEIRGVTVTTEIMRVLIDREWIRQSGTREVPGHPALYVTTPLFLEYFGLGSISELPSLEDERQLAEIAKELGIDMPESLRISEPRDSDGEIPDSDAEDTDLAHDDGSEREEELEEGLDETPKEPQAALN
ncbi:MAG: SMC-Scp complex subunit ScpB [Gammaproteobacteria bacterium]|jgi:segregation and condensation protein B